MGAGLTAVLTHFGIFDSEQPKPFIAKVNVDDELLSYWPSEDLFAEDEDPDCRFYNGSIIYKSDLCSHFVISRSSSTPKRAFSRALACAVQFNSDCILSPEIGLAIPAAFLINGSSVTMVVAPRLFPLVSDQRQVRVKSPGESASTRTSKFMVNVDVEFLDGLTRGVRRNVFSHSESYCIQLLRQAFVSDCWGNLD